MNEGNAASRQRRAGLREAAMVAALAGTALLGAACRGGGSHATAPTAATGRAPSGLTTQKVDAYAQCMRGHGLPNFYITSSVSSSQDAAVTTMELGPHWFIPDVDPSSPQLQSAQKA